MVSWLGDRSISASFTKLIQSRCTTRSRSWNCIALITFGAVDGVDSSRISRMLSGGEKYGAQYSTWKNVGFLWYHVPAVWLVPTSFAWLLLRATMISRPSTRFNRSSNCAAGPLMGAVLFKCPVWLKKVYAIPLRLHRATGEVAEHKVRSPILRREVFTRRHPARQFRRHQG